MREEGGGGSNIFKKCIKKKGIPCKNMRIYEFYVTLNITKNIVLKSYIYILTFKLHLNLGPTIFYHSKYLIYILKIIWNMLLKAKIQRLNSFTIKYQNCISISVLHQKKFSVIKTMFLLSIHICISYNENAQKCTFLEKQKSIRRKPTFTLQKRCIFGKSSNIKAEKEWFKKKAFKANEFYIRINK